MLISPNLSLLYLINGQMSEREGKLRKNSHPRHTTYRLCVDFFFSFFYLFHPMRSLVLGIQIVWERGCNHHKASGSYVLGARSCMLKINTSFNVAYGAGGDGPLENLLGGGVGEVQNNIRARENSYKEFDNEKKFLRLENYPPPAPITFLMVRPKQSDLQRSYGNTINSFVTQHCQMYCAFACGESWREKWRGKKEK